MGKALFLFLLLSIPFKMFGSIDDSLQNLVNKAPTDRDKINAMNEFIGKCKYKGINDKLIVYANQEVELAKKIKDPKLVALGLLDLGMLYTNTQEYKTAFQYTLRAAAIDDSIHNTFHLIRDYLALGSLLRFQKNNKGALEYYKSGLQLARSTRDSKNTTYSYYVIGQLFDIMGQFDSAVAYDKMALEMATRLKLDFFANEATEELATAYGDQGNFTLSIVYQKKSIAHYLSTNDLRMIGTVYNNLAYDYLRMKKLDSAEFYANLSLPAFQKSKLKDGLMLIYGTLMDVASGKKDYKAAFDYALKYIALQDSVTTENNGKQIAELNTKYQTSVKNNQITEQKAEINRSHLVIYGSFGFAFLILTAAGFVFFNYRKIRRLSFTLTEQKASLEEVNKLKDKLFSIISHDLRSPLAHTVALIELVNRGEIGPEKMQAYSVTLSTALAHNLQLLDNLLNWAASQIKGMKINKADISLQALIDESVQAIQSAAAKKNILIEEKESFDTKVHADLSMAKLVLRNILSNALKYTPEGGKITVYSIQEGEKAKITVADTGVGMSEERKNLLFTGLLSPSTEGTRAEKGFGIGLNLCKEFVEKNGGTITVESKPGKGSSFSFTLPLAA